MQSLLSCKWNYLASQLKNPSSQKYGLKFSIFQLFFKTGRHWSMLKHPHPLSTPGSSTLLAQTHFLGNRGIIMRRDEHKEKFMVKIQTFCMTSLHVCFTEQIFACNLSNAFMDAKMLLWMEICTLFMYTMYACILWMNICFTCLCNYSCTCLFINNDCGTLTEVLTHSTCTRLFAPRSASFIVKIVIIKRLSTFTSCSHW